MDCGINGGCRDIPYLPEIEVKGYIQMLHLPKMDCQIMLVEEPLAAEVALVSKLAGVVVGLMRGHP